MRPIAIIIAALFVAGCVEKDRKASDVAGNAIQRIDARIDSAERAVVAAKPHTDATGKELLSLASAEHRATKLDVRDADAALVKAAAQVRAQEDRYRDLEGHWYVRWGRRIQAAVVTIASVWGVLGVLVVLTGFSPVGALFGAGKEIVRLLPFMNPFAWVRDFIMKRRGEETAVVAVKGKK